MQTHLRLVIFNHWQKEAEKTLKTHLQWKHETQNVLLWAKGLWGGYGKAVLSQSYSWCFAWSRVTVLCCSSTRGRVRIRGTQTGQWGCRQVNFRIMALAWGKDFIPARLILESTESICDQADEADRFCYCRWVKCKYVYWYPLKAVRVLVSESEA